MVLREAELGYVRRLVREIEGGTLEGIEWWNKVHASPGEPVPSPIPLTSGIEDESRKRTRRDRGRPVGNFEGVRQRARREQTNGQHYLDQRFTENVPLAARERRRGAGRELRR